MNAIVTGIYKIADKVIEINSLYEEVHTLCEAYSSLEEPNFSVEVVQADIDA